jgi:hypothetical protein
VPRFLSAEWVAAFSAAVADVDLPEPGSDAGLAVRDGSFAACVIAERDEDDTAPVTLRVARGRASLTEGEEPDAGATVRVTWQDAAAIMSGALDPTSLLSTGRARARGDLSVLAAARVVLAALGPQLTALQAATEY